MRTSVPALLCALVLACAPAAALACACCTEPGQRLVGSQPLDDYRRGELLRMRFAPEAALFLPSGDAADARGIGDPSDGYRVQVRFDGRSRLVFALSADGRARGTLALPLPAAVDVFEVDPREGEPDPTGLGPRLYKEWTLRAAPAASGDFSPAGAPGTVATLILHGRGGGCSSAEEFTRWTLALRGPGVDYMLLGELLAPAAEAPAQAAPRDEAPPAGGATPP